MQKCAEDTCILCIFVILGKHVRRHRTQSQLPARHPPPRILPPRRQSQDSHHRQHHSPPPTSTGRSPPGIVRLSHGLLHSFAGVLPHLPIPPARPCRRSPRLLAQPAVGFHPRSGSQPPTRPRHRHDRCTHHRA